MIPMVYMHGGQQSPAVEASEEMGLAEFARRRLGFTADPIQTSLLEIKAGGC